MDFRVLGSLAVTADDGASVGLGGPRPRAVLAVLLCQPNQVVSADRLVDSVWGESPPASAASALQVHVSALRKALGAGRIETRAPGYLLVAESDEVDAARFERLAADGEAALARGEARRASERLAEALRLWHGEPFADVADLPAVRPEAERLAERRLVALEARIDADLALGRHASLVGELEAVVATQPLRERPRAQLMLALYRSGRQADALAAYRDAHRTLADELGIVPGPELRELQRRILEQDPSLDLPSPTEPAPAPVVAAPQLIGRDLELAAVTSLLGEHRLVTLTGTGGVGKTSLALGAAHELGDFAFADLAPLADAELVLSSIARALEVDEDPSRPLLELVAERLGQAPPLLLLDNLEHLPASFTLVSELLASAPALRVLATSRVRLGLTAEREYRVPPLVSPPPGGESVEALRSNDAVQLYVDRARRALPDFELTASNAHAVARICRALDGLPLAIELAAARIRVLGPDGTARRLGESLALLTRDAPDLPERRRSLRAAIEWSHGLLTDDERHAFAALAVFAGAATLEAIEALLDGSTAPALIERLLEANLVTHEPTPDGEPRFGMLATIRAFAAEQLADSGREQELRDRQLTYCVRVVSGAFEARRTDASAYLRVVVPEDRDNYRAALTHAAGRGLADELLELTVGLIEFWRTTGALDEGRRWHEQAVAVGAHADPRLRGRGLYGLAMFTYMRGDVAAAVVTVEQAIALLEVHGSPVELARALWLRSACANIEGDPAMARALYERALELARVDGDDVLTGRLLIGLSETHRKMGDLDAARAHATESLAVTERLGDDEFRAWALVHLAGYAIEADDLADARAKLSEALTVGRELDDLETLAISTLFAAVVAGRADDVLAAAELVGVSHALFVELGEARWEIEREYWEPLLAVLERVLGDRLGPLRARGAGLPRNGALALALESLEGAGATTSPGPTARPSADER